MSQRVYTVVHETTFLDWGLTSEWALTTPGRTRQCAAAAAAVATPSRSAAKDGNAASEGAGASAFSACPRATRSRNGAVGVARHALTPPNSAQAMAK